MSVLLFAEHSQGSFKKAVYEAATYGYELAQAMGTDFVAVSIGQVENSELEKLGQYGVSKVYKIGSDHSFCEPTAKAF